MRNHMDMTEKDFIKIDGINKELKEYQKLIIKLEGISIYQRHTYEGTGEINIINY